MLYIIGTPIGNLADLTYRAVATLQSVDAVYAEDTRVSQKLLRHYQIDKPLRSYRESAPRSVVERTISEIISRLRAGENLVYLTDAGTPGVSDPGNYLISQVTTAGLPVVPIPGPSSLATLLSVAGMPVARPLFIGFLPKKKGHQTLMKQLKQVLLEEVADSLVFYESPERIHRLLEELLEWNMPLQICLGRELTKMHEEIIRGRVEDVLAELKKPVKGEITLIVSHL